MIDVFLRVAPQNWLRTGMAISCIEAWKLQSESLNLRIISTNRLVGGNEIFARHAIEFVLLNEDFHWTSRIWADEHAESEPYVMADDDRLPLGTDWLESAVGFWDEYNGDRKYPMLVEVSAIKAERYTDAPEFNNDLPVQESPYWFGCNYLSYKRAIDYRQFSGTANLQDQIVGEWAAKNGIKQAVMKSVLSNHLGYGYSQVQPKLFGRY